MRIKNILLSALLLVGGSELFAQDYGVQSPDGTLELDLTVGTTITYQVKKGGIQLIDASSIGLALSNGTNLGDNASVSGTSSRNVDEVITRIYGKTPTLSDNFNELTINFTGNYSLIIRAYNEGVAWRFVTAMAGDVNVNSETATFNFTGTPGVIFPEADSEMRSWERSYYTYQSINEIAVNRFCVTPALFMYQTSGIKVAVAESDLFDYPGMYLQRTATGMKGKWAQYPKTVSDPDNIYSYHRVTARESFLAKTKGTREYPWRVVIVTTEDKDLLNTELVYKLAKPSVLTTTSYIKPGKSAWEWWHDAILETNSIPSGLNHLSLDLYKYYVDFAAQYGLEYITMDAGWSTDYAAQLCTYAASKNVKVFAWDFINMPIEQPGRLLQLQQLGIAGVKIDLIERDDQVAINWFETIAKKASELGMMVIFHGCGKPTGLQRTYPNIVNFEAVRGAECDKWDDSANPDYHLQFPFIRMLGGPLDYTPGSMRNVHRSEFTPTGSGIPKSMGTRAHEVAMYVMFDQYLGYLCDSPTEYRKFDDVIRFISRVPASWDETVPLAAEVGEYAVIAKRKGQEWHLAAMTNGEPRDLDIDFSFLPSGNFFAEIIRDNAVTETNAKSITREIVQVTNQSKISYHLAQGGGVAIYITNLTITGLNDKPEKRFSVYQNTARTQLTISAEEALETVYIADVSGRILFTRDLSRENRTTTEVDISNLSNSQVYLVYGNTKTRAYATKFIK